MAEELQAYIALLAAAVVVVAVDAKSRLVGQSEVRSRHERLCD